MMSSPVTAELAGNESDTDSFVDALEALATEEIQEVKFSDEENRVKPTVSTDDSARVEIEDCETHSESETSRSISPSNSNPEVSNAEEQILEDDTSSITDEQKESDINEEYMKEKEEQMTEEEKQTCKEQARVAKVEGNRRFNEENYQGALESYTEALQTCPLCFTKERSIMYSNRAACKLRMERYDSAIGDSNKAIELNPVYLKALMRRAELHEKKEQYEEALKDYQQSLELDSSLVKAKIACATLPDKVKERNEKMKEEMMGKLKDLGNMVLRPFGLSTQNFNLQQDPNTGSYSVQFQQNAPQPPPTGNGP